MQKSVTKGIPSAPMLPLGHSQEEVGFTYVDDAISHAETLKRKGLVHRTQILEERVDLLEKQVKLLEDTQKAKLLEEKQSQLGHVLGRTVDGVFNGLLDIGKIVCGEPAISGY